MVQGPWSHSLALVKWQCVKWDFFQRRSNVVKSRRKNRILSLDYGLLICCKLALPFPENFKKNAGERVLLSATLCPLTALQLLSVVTIPCFTSRDLFQLYHGKPRTFEQLCRQCQGLRDHLGAQGAAEQPVPPPAGCGARGNPVRRRGGGHDATRGTEGDTRWKRGRWQSWRPAAERRKEALSKAR